MGLIPLGALVFHVLSSVPLILQGEDAELTGS